MRVEKEGRSERWYENELGLERWWDDKRNMLKITLQNSKFSVSFTPPPLKPYLTQNSKLSV